MRKWNELSELENAFQKFEELDLTEQEYEESFQSIMLTVKQESITNKRKKQMGYTATAVLVAATIFLLFNNYESILNPFINKGEEQVVDDQTEQPIEEEGFAFEISDPSKENIQVVLDKFEISNYTWSPNEGAVIFADGYEEDNETYIWNVGEKRAKLIEVVLQERVTSFLWAPDTKKVLVSSGTSVVQTAHIIETGSLRKIDEFTYAFQPVWSPDSEYLAIGVVNWDIQPVVDVEIGPVDIAIYSLETKQVENVVAGTAEFYNVPKSWSTDNMLAYTQVNFEDRLEEEKSIDVSYITFELPVDEYRVFSNYNLGPITYLSETMTFYFSNETGYWLGSGMIAEAAEVYQLYEVSDDGQSVKIIRTMNEDFNYDDIGRMKELDNWQEEMIQHMLNNTETVNEVYFTFDANVVEEQIEIDGEMISLYPVKIGEDTHYFRKGFGLWARYLENERVLDLYGEPSLVYRMD